MLILEKVPEEYAEIVMGYLKTVEGGARSVSVFSRFDTLG